MDRSYSTSRVNYITQKFESCNASTYDRIIFQVSKSSEESCSLILFLKSCLMNEKECGALLNGD